MKKIILIFSVISIVFFSCQYEKEEYTIIREFGPGTYKTIWGAAKYFSGNRDSVNTIRDVYALATERVVYMNQIDSVLFYGHCWGTTSQPRVTDTTASFFTAEGEVSAINFPLNSFVASKGDEQWTYQSPLVNLTPVTEYYVRSYVVTGRLDGTNRDTAYNPYSAKFTTLQTRDKWEIRKEFEERYFKGGISFVYNNKLYVGMGANDGDISRDIFMYDPQSDTWTTATTYPGQKTADAVAFVIENVNTQVGVYKDFVYIGSGYTLKGDGTEEVLQTFYRWEPATGAWTVFDNLSVFPSKRKNAIAFSIKGRGYVGFGQGSSGSVFYDLYQLNPHADKGGVDDYHPQGTWRTMENMPGLRKLTKAVSFVIGDYGYVTTGVDFEGNYQRRLWRFQAPESDNEDDDGGWVERKQFPGTARIDAVGFSIENFGYVGTGWDGDSLRSDFWRYNPFINDWEEKARFIGTPRREAVGGGLYYGEVFGNDEFRGYIGTGIVNDPEDPYTDSFYHYLP